MAVRRKGKSKRPQSSASKLGPGTTPPGRGREPLRVTRSCLCKLTIAPTPNVQRKRNGNKKPVRFQLPESTETKVEKQKKVSKKAVTTFKQRKARTNSTKTTPGKQKPPVNGQFATPTGSKAPPKTIKVTPTASRDTPTTSTPSRLPTNVNYMTKGNGNITVIGRYLEKGACFSVGRPENCTYSPRTKELLICDTMHNTVKAMETDGTNSRVLYYVKTPRDITTSDNGEFVYLLTNQEYTSDIVKMTLDGYIVPGKMKFWNELGVCSSIICHSNHIAVLSTNQKTMSLFDMDLKFVRSFYLAEMLFPRGGTAVDNDGNFYITDDSNGSVHVYSWTGEWLRKFGFNEPELSHDRRTTRGICVDGDGMVCVSRTYRNTIEVYDNEGKFVRGFGKSGTNDGEFDEPAGLYLLEDGRLVVMDESNFRVQIL